MAISWHWAWGPESIATLQADYGFAFSTLSSMAPTSAVGEVYTYAGSPTRYSMSARSGRTTTLPAAAFPATSQGWVAIPFKNAAAPTLASGPDIIEVIGALSARRTYVDVGTDLKSLRLFVSNIFKESTLPFDWTDWKYVALRWDMSTTTWSGRLYVDGVAATALYTDTTGTAAETGGAISLVSAAVSTGLDWLIGQIICRDALGDAGEVRRFVTRVEPGVDGTNIGVWTPSVGVDDFAVLATPLDVSTYTENTVPSALDRVEVVPATDLDTALGTTTTAIDSVMVHGYSSGQAITARVLVGDGTASETAGTTEAISVGATSITEAVANLKPSGGAWAGTDTPDFIYEVVSV